MLEIIDGNNNITIAKDIVNFNYSGSKQINNITEYDNKLYLSTSFAIILYDLENSQFGDTYFIEDQSSEIIINQIKIYEGTIYAATEDGIFTADITNPNLIDFNNWTQYSSGNFSSIEVFNNKIVVSNNNNLYTFENNMLLLQKTYAATIKNLKASEENLSIITQRGVYVNDLNNLEVVNYVAASTDRKSVV